jgi:hypothetical protein
MAGDTAMSHDKALVVSETRVTQRKTKAIAIEQSAILCNYAC